MKRCLHFALVCVLTGCSSLAAVSPVVDKQLLVGAVQQCAAPQPIDPLSFMEVGFTKVKAACEIFFVNATKAQQNALAASTALNAGLVGATSILNATTSAASAAKAITITQAGVVFAEAIITDYVNVYTFKGAVLATSASDARISDIELDSSLLTTVWEA